MSIKIYNENSQRIGIHAKQPQGVGVGVNVNTAIDDINKHIAEIEEDLKSKGIHYIPKTAFVCTEGADNLSMRWDLNSVEGITQPFAGMSIALQIPLVSTFTSGVVLSIDGGKTYHPVLKNKATPLTHSYGEDAVVMFIYNDLASTRVYLEDNIQTTLTGCWQVSDYDSDKCVHQSSISTDGDFPILTKPTSNTATTIANVSFSSKVTLNPKTGAVSATTFYENGIPLGDKYGRGVNEMPVIRLAAVSDLNRSGVVGPTNPVRISIQVVSGNIAPTDRIELCSKKAMTYKKYDTSADATRKKGRRWRLRKIAEKSASVCHDKSCAEGVYRMFAWDVGDPITPRAFLRSDNLYASRKNVTKYVRVVRFLNDGQSLFSNVVEFSFSVDSLVRPAKNSAKIHLK